MPANGKSQSQLAFAECFHRIQCPSSAQRLWERHLSAADRDQFDSDLPAAYRQYRTAGLWAKLRGISLDRGVLEVGLILNFLTRADYEWLVREIGEFSNPEESMAAAIAAGDLVLLESPREAYWDSEKIDIDWNRFNSCWEFLWELSRHAKSGCSIDRLTFGSDTSDDIVAKRKHHLSTKSEFPISLADLMVPSGRGTQRLTLVAERIRIFQQSGNGRLSEWRP